jgi:hypothetical protein
MLRRSFIFRQVGGNKSHQHPLAFNKKEYRDHHRDISSEALKPQRPAPAYKLPQLVNINKSCPVTNSAPKGGSALLKQKQQLDGLKLIGAAFRAHQRVAERKSKNNNSNSDTQTEFLYYDQHCMVIPDEYPKSTFHFLVMPRISKYPKLNSIADITSDDLPLLKHMDSVCAEIVKSIFTVSKQIPSLANRKNFSEEEEILEKILNDENTSGKMSEVSQKDLLRDWLFRPRSPLSHLHPVSQLRFMSGCHVLPSLCPLHFHLTSLDMQSDALKNKKHYNTFTTSFFVSRTRIEEEISKHRYVKFALDNENLQQMEDLENQSPMICAWCQYQCKSVPELKEHLRNCKSNGCYFVQGNVLAAR